MIIRGILDNSLNGQLCIRGFALIRELARISKADYSYQRGLTDRSDITDFLEKQTYLFFPEIILGYKVKYTLGKTEDDKPPLSKVQAGKNFKSTVDKTRINVRTIEYKQSQDLTDKSNVRIVELIFDDTELDRLIKDDKHPLSRIDGNHRLRAAESSDVEKVNRMVAPFCIILGEELYQDGIVNDKINEFDKATKVFFHNINTKTIPLTSEENLKVLIDDKLCFSDSELEEVLGREGLLTRQLIDKYNYAHLTGIKHIIGNNYRSCYLEIFRILENENKDVERVLEALKDIDRFYARNDKLKANSSFGLLYSFLYYKIQNNGCNFTLFKNWVLNNNIFDIGETKVESIIKIFDKIAEHEIRMFIAMPYYKENPDIVREYNNIYEGVIEEIRRKYKIRISLFPIMENRGETQDQIQDIINKIKQCSIFIADISDNNPNVMYETGWARALDKHVILFREKSSEEPKSDYANDTYHKYDNDMRSLTLHKIALENIVEVLNKNFGLIYE
jgi:hypothetical protein